MKWNHESQASQLIVVYGYLETYNFMGRPAHKFVSNSYPEFSDKIIVSRLSLLDKPLSQPTSLSESGWGLLVSPLLDDCGDLLDDDDDFHWLHRFDVLSFLASNCGKLSFFLWQASYLLSNFITYPEILNTFCCLLPFFFVWYVHSLIFLISS